MIQHCKVILCLAVYYTMYYVVLADTAYCVVLADTEHCVVLASWYWLVLCGTIWYYCWCSVVLCPLTGVADLCGSRE